MPLKREKIFKKIGLDLIAMSKIVFEQMDLVKDQLEGRDVADRDEKFDQNELVIDGFEVKMRRNVANSIMLYTARASDMRKLMSCYDITIQLERMGDLFLNIHKHLRNVNFEGEIYTALREDLFKLYSTTETMVRNSIASYTDKDMVLSRTTMELDDVVDDLFADVRRRLVEVSKERPLTEAQLREMLAISGLSYNFERIADNATNIIESSVYLVEGRNIQHESNIAAQEEISDAE